MRLCVGQVERAPGADVVLMHKLMFEGDEQECLRIANQLWAAGESAEQELGGQQQLTNPDMEQMASCPLDARAGEWPEESSVGT